MSGGLSRPPNRVSAPVQKMKRGPTVPRTEAAAQPSGVPAAPAGFELMRRTTPQDQWPAPGRKHGPPDVISSAVAMGRDPFAPFLWICRLVHCQWKGEPRVDIGNVLEFVCFPRYAVVCIRP